MINTISAVKFGNMTVADGLDGIFDSDENTRGYVEGPEGWAGVSLGQSSSIDRAEFTSMANGFDGSGLETNITLKLYGKTGSAPVTPTDGILLGSSTFVDQNTIRTITIESNDKVTKFDHIWGVVLCGVWSILKDLELYESSEPPSPQISPYVLESTHVQTLQKSCNEVVPIMQTADIIEQFTFALEVLADGSFDLDCSINVVHRGELLSPQFLGAVGIGATIKYKHSSDLASLESKEWMRLPVSSTCGINIDERNPAHYANVCMTTGHPAVPGYYLFSIAMSAHTDGTNQNGVAAVLSEFDGINGFRIRYNPGGEFIDMSGV